MLRLAGENVALINTVFDLHDALLSLDLCRCNFPEPSEIVMIHRVNKCPNESDLTHTFFSLCCCRMRGTRVLDEPEVSFQWLVQSYLTIF